MKRGTHLTENQCKFVSGFRFGEEVGGDRGGSKGTVGSGSRLPKAYYHKGATFRYFNVGDTVLFRFPGACG